MTSPSVPHPAVREALEVLGTRNLLLGIHDPAFPSKPEEDLGRGSPYSEGAADFLDFVRSLGFDGVQLGPQGMTSAINPSPYDGTLFSRNPLSLAFLPLTRPEWGALLPPDGVARVVASRLGPPERVSHRRVWGAVERLTAQILSARHRAGNPEAPRLRGFGEFRRRAAEWLERDGLFEALQREEGGRDWLDWSHEGDRRLWTLEPARVSSAAARRRVLLARHRDEIEDYAFVQFLIHEQHREFQDRARRLGLKLFGDLQIGMAGRDAWAAQESLLDGYRMGAPPSRTNPEGQPWGYPVLDPLRYFDRTGNSERRDGPAVHFLRSRMVKLFEEFDGIRVDHPHGLVCPWVYRAGETDPLRAVQRGARLFASPDLPDHPGLARFAIPRPDQIDPSLARYADAWVRDLDEAQVDRYAALFNVVVETARHNGRGTHEIACEILSTQPYPIGRVMERHGLGRFRVTQKADLGRADDVYRSENARPEDWIMLGNHDTRPIWLATEEWTRSGSSRDQAEYLAWRLLAPEEDREAWVRRVAEAPAALAQAKFADLFLGPARNVLVFFTDLMGYAEPYNRPGTVTEENWSLRVSSGYRAGHAARLAEGRALDVPKALARALRSRGRSFAEVHSGLLSALDRLAASPA